MDNSHLRRSHCVKERLAWVLMPTYQMSGVSLSCGNQLYLQHSVSKEWNSHWMKVMIKLECGGLSRCLSGQEHLLLLQKSQILFPASMWWLTSLHDANFKGSDPFLWPLQAPGTHMVHIHICRQNTRIYKRNMSCCCRYPDRYLECISPRTWFS